MAYKINADNYSYSANPEKNSQNYAAELAKKIVNEEAEARRLGDEALKQDFEISVEAESESRREAVKQFQARLDTEAVLRQSTDNTLKEDIAVEAELRTEEDSRLSGLVSALTQRLSTEESNRKSNDTLIQNKASEFEILVSQTLEAEANARQRMENDLSQQISGKADIIHNHTADEVGALPDTTIIPSMVSDLENDKGYLTEHQDISGKADINHKHPEYLTEHQDISQKVDKSEMVGVWTMLDDLDKGKADKTIIETFEATSFSFYFSLTYNGEMRLAEVSSISFTFGNGEYAADYISGLSFDSGDTATAIDYTDSGILNWVGTDCTNVDGLSIFQPSANTHYDIVFYFNGTQFIGLVNGFVPATGNEAV